VFQFCKGKEFFSKEYWGYALRIGIPIVPHYLSGIILNQGDRIMIDKMVGKTEVALYGLAYSIGMLVQLFISGMNSALTPWMYSKIKKGDIRSMRKVLQLLSIVVVGIAVALMLISPELVLIFGSPKYREAVYVIPPVAASVFFIFIYNILSMPQFYYEKTVRRQDSPLYTLHSERCIYRFRYFQIFIPTHRGSRSCGWLSQQARRGYRGYRL